MHSCFSSIGNCRTSHLAINAGHIRVGSVHVALLKTNERFVSPRLYIESGDCLHCLHMEFARFLTRELVYGSMQGITTLLA